MYKVSQARLYISGFFKQFFDNYSMDGWYFYIKEEKMASVKVNSAFAPAGLFSGEQACLYL